jgi:hypothetical protein
VRNFYISYYLRYLHSLEKMSSRELDSLGSAQIARNTTIINRVFLSIPKHLSLSTPTPTSERGTREGEAVWFDLDNMVDEQVNTQALVEI